MPLGVRTAAGRRGQVAHLAVLTALPRANDLRHAWPADFGSMPGSTFQMD